MFVYGYKYILFYRNISDSEVAIVVEDIEFEEFSLNGNVTKVGKSSFQLRNKLLMEHLGFEESIRMVVLFLNDTNVFLNGLNEIRISKYLINRLMKVYGN